MNCPLGNTWEVWGPRNGVGGWKTVVHLGTRATTVFQPPTPFLDPQTSNLQNFQMSLTTGVAIPHVVQQICWTREQPSWWYNLLPLNLRHLSNSYPQNIRVWITRRQHAVRSYSRQRRTIGYLSFLLLMNKAYVYSCTFYERNNNNARKSAMPWDNVVSS